MDTLAMLKLMIMEDKYPYFTDDQLQNFLTQYNNDLNLTASRLCLMKKDGEKSIKFGPIEIQNADPDYWQNLSDTYADDYALAQSTKNSNPSDDDGYYASSMSRPDEVDLSTETGIIYD